MRLLLAVSVLAAGSACLASAQNFSAPTGAEPIQKTEPEYSEEARLAGLEGTVVLTGTITDQGLPQDMRVTKPLGLGLDEKALEAVQQWRFTPSTHNGQLATVAVDFRLPDIQSRWHLVRAEFDTPAGVSRPHFLKTTYPLGAGISLRAFEEALVIRAIRREATATVTFEVDENGNPLNPQVLSASHPIWGPEALAVVRDWQFSPGTKNGAPVSVPCTLDLVWGPTNLNSQALEWAQTQLHAPQIPDVPSPFRSGDDYLHPVVVSAAPASYTDAARTAGLQGTVLLSVLIAEDGTPSNIRVLRPLGLGLDQKAVEAVLQWRFRPVLVNGQPTRTRAAVEVQFSLPK